MVDHDAGYLRHRAEIEIERARDATAPEAVRVDREAYLERVAMPEGAVSECQTIGDS